LGSLKLYLKKWNQRIGEVVEESVRVCVTFGLAEAVAADAVSPFVSLWRKIVSLVSDLFGPVVETKEQTSAVMSFAAVSVCHSLLWL